LIRLGLCCHRSSKLENHKLEQSIIFTMSMWIGPSHLISSLYRSAFRIVQDVSNRLDYVTLLTHNSGKPGFSGNSEQWNYSNWTIATINNGRNSRNFIFTLTIANLPFPFFVTDFFLNILYFVVICYTKKVMLNISIQIFYPKSINSK